MKFYPVTEPKTGGRPVRENIDNTVAYNIHTQKNGVKTSVFTIGVNLVKKARFIDGDYLTIAKSFCGNFGLISRTNADDVHGRKLLANKSGKVRTVSCKYSKKMPYTDSLIVLADVQVTDDGIFFGWPKTHRPPGNE